MSGKTSTASKRLYNEKAYDRISLVVKKGRREELKAYAESKGMSINGYINKLIDEDMKTALVGCLTTYLILIFCPA